MKTKEEVLTLFRDKYAYLKTVYPSVGPFDDTVIYQNPDGGWQLNLSPCAAITLRPDCGEPYETHGAICARWYEEGGAFNEDGKPGKLGYPVNDEDDFHGSDAKPGDRFSIFQHARIVWRMNLEKTEIHSDPTMRKEGDIGLVLSGGGAKGAFQAGVWKAMCELGLAEHVRAISGTSVGAINGAAFAAIRDPDTICRFWREHVGEVATPNLKHLSLDAIRHSIENTLAGRAFPFHGLLDRDVLQGLVSGLLPSRWPEDSPSLHATTLECRAGILGELNRSSYRLRRFRIDEEPDAARRTAKILASAAIPWGFDPVELDGKRYVDGGWEENGGDNVPTAPLLRLEYGIQTVVIVRCNSVEADPAPLRKRFRSGVNVIEVRPSSTLPGIFGDVAKLLSLSSIPILGRLSDGLEKLARQLRIWSGTLAFDRAYAERYIAQGYADGLATLRDLKPKAKLEW